MNDHILTLEKAENFTKFPEMFNIFWKDWHAITEVEHEALEYLVNNSSRIILPNVTQLSESEKELLRSFKGQLEIGVKL